ncbi:hypothetical protein CC78DRAFT_580974 [Lojkania enalia]|uniref:Uncharacterized protein n=1 Tax=Lojkania enalia TaxID=147567 RepID=A0A9P4K861_9PLEO|nr:hypothetical protein CC78DRAFT_580974 [Didymosphaeria enalia]
MMDEIFKNATINIADASVNVEESEEAMSMGRICETDSRASYTGQLESRGWVLQECLLALPLYTTTHLSFITKARPDSDGFSESPKYKARTRRLIFVKRALKKWSSLSLFWIPHVHWYSKRKPMVESDRLPAISGLSRLIGKSFKLSYIARIRLDYVCPSLLWSALKLVKRSSAYLALSWSRASLLPPIMHQNVDINASPGSEYTPELATYRVYLNSDNVYGMPDLKSPSYLQLCSKL